MANANLFAARGLHTYNNNVAGVPEGSQAIAKNVNIDRTGVIEPRRGFKVFRSFTNSADRAKQLFSYKGGLLVHYENNLAYDNGISLVNYSDPFVEAQNGIRTKSVESNGNLYLTSNEGIKKLSTATTLSAATISDAGAPRALAGTAIPNYSSIGFLSALSKVGYRITWCILDVNQNVIEGVPSPFFECINPSSTISCQATITFDPPPDATNQHFYRVYRTAVVSASTLSDLTELILSDELNLVYEGTYDGSGNAITFTDIAPEDFRRGNLPLYTNEISGEGFSQANFRPPYSLFIESYKGYVWYANTRQRHFKLLSVLGVANVKSYGGSSVYDVNSNLDLLALDASIGIVNVVINSSNDLEITFSALPTEINAVGKRIFLSSTDDVLSTSLLHGTVSAYNKEYVISAISGTTITLTGPFSGTTTPSKTVVYTFYVSIQKGSNPEFRYWIGGLKSITEFTVSGYSSHPPTTLYPNDKFITIYSANNKYKYGIWFAHNPTDSPASFDGVTIRVNLYAASMTAAEVAEAIANAIEEQTLDLEAVTFGTSSDKVRVCSLISGITNNPTVDPALTGITALTIVQKGVGEKADNRLVLLPRSLTSAALNIDEFTRSLVRTINKNTSQGATAFYIFSPTTTPGQFEITSTDFSNNQLTIDAYPVLMRENFNPTLPTISENLTKSNRIYYSKFRQPEAVPIANYFDIGSSDEEIKNIVALRDSLFVFKRDGIFKISGDSPNSFFITLLDKSAYLLTSDAVTVLNNIIYAFTSQGVVQVGESGVGIVSRGIENLLEKYYSPTYSNVLKHIYMTASEEDRCLLLALPENPTSTYADKFLRYSILTQAWTEWTLTSTCAVRLDNKFYLGAGNLNAIEIERKDFSKYDYADRIFVKDILANGFISPNQYKLSNLANVEVGDQFYQKQAVTISKFNQLTAQLANDPSILALPPAQQTFYQTHKATYGDSIQNKLSVLGSTLNAHFSTTIFPTSFSASVTTLYTQYNAFINILNTTTFLTFTNYPQLTDYTYIEAPIKELDTQNNIAKLIVNAPFLEGEVEIHKAISTDFEYNPISFGDVGILKQIRYTSALFANADLVLASLGFASDLSPYFEYVNFGLEGDGSWGTFLYNSTSWGGFGTQVPFRTIVPRQKQRCRFIRIRFKHKVAFYKYLFYGLSFDFDASSTRAYR